MHGSRQTYGSPRCIAELLDRRVQVLPQHGGQADETGQICGQDTTAVPWCRTTDSDHDHPIMANVLDRQFVADHAQPQVVLPTSPTCRPRGLAVPGGGDGPVQPQNRRLEHGRSSAGPAMPGRVSRWRSARKPARPGLLHHSDRGVQYACDEYQRLLAMPRHSLSMSRTGNCYDNAAMESFFGTLKTELIYRPNLRDAGSGQTIDLRVH